MSVIAGHLMADRGACVSDCGAGRHANSDGKCVPCDGPCPKGKFYRLLKLFLERHCNVMCITLAATSHLSSGRRENGTGPTVSLIRPDHRQSCGAQ